MTRRCDRCRSEYESGADFGGHDYCMTCYSRVKQEEEQKRAMAEKQQQQKIEYRQQQLHQQYLEDAKRRQVEEDARRRELEVKRQLPSQDESDIRKRMKWSIAAKYHSREGEAPVISALPRVRRKQSISVLQKKDEYATYASRSKQTEKNVVKHTSKQPIKPIPQTNLSLSISAGLPVSLSIGQKQVQVLLLGKNTSTMPIAVGLDVTLLDSQKNTIAAKSEPRTCTIGPDGESKIKVAFDLPEDAARGMLSFTALLKENAVYIGKPAAQSNAVSLSSQVKSSMDLQYKRGSALFESDALCLTFNNVGESGGILEMSSSVTYFSQESVGKKATLMSRTKVKGGEKNILLRFAPAEKTIVSKLELRLVGKDSNGKPYLLKRKISGKDTLPADEEKNNKTE